MKTIALGLACLVLIAAAGLAAALGLFRPRAPAPIDAIQAADTLIGQTGGAVPAYRFIPARDGQPLGYRLYEGRAGGGVAVLVHGSSGSSIAVHAVGRALADAGITAYAIDLRGHGESGPLGDAAYRGQPEDDLADLVALIAREHPAEKRVLIGHSLGGAFVLRAAAGPVGQRFDGVLALAPYLSPDPAVNRPNTGGWTDVAVPRIVALSILNRLGVSVFDGLAVIAYAVPADAPGKRASIYSWRLLASLSLPRDWRAALGRIDRPTEVLIGADDQLFVPQAYPGVIASANPRIRTSLLPGIDHMGIVIRPEAIGPIAAATERLLGR
ncbi:alpha/beta hydrolase [Phreatobacter sp.]|uniref:alpha/beta hydrolase n=1 Tax=Phreatobacter sp. TaxID=1966341 RepID=UPI003F6FDE23